MSSGHEKKPEEVKLITLDPEEFDRVVKRVHQFLLNRVEHAKDRKDRKPTPRAEEKHVEAAKDVFVFVHMLDLIEHMSGEIADLRDQLGGQLESAHEDQFPELFAVKKTKYLN